MVGCMWVKNSFSFDKYDRDRTSMSMAVHVLAKQGLTSEYVITHVSTAAFPRICCKNSSSYN